MIKRPEGMSALEFTVLASLRAVQLSRGCTPRVPTGSKITVLAQQEVAGGFIRRMVSVADRT